LLQLTAWEQQHVAHHIAELRRPRATPGVRAETLVMELPPVEIAA
jgi:hypothetical protein